MRDIVAPDPATVVITVTHPTPNLLTNIGGFKGMAIVSRRNVESGQIATHPVGTGPFAFAGRKSGDSISLSANPAYWGSPPRVPGVTFRFISEPSTALSALQAGEIDWTDAIPTQRVAQLKSDDSLTLAVTPGNDYWYLALNEARAPWNDVRVRRAIAYGIDRSAIVAATSYGTANANQLAIPQGNPWYTPYDTYRHDIDRAASLLRKAGVDKQDLDMLVTNEYPETVTAAQIVADNLAPLGISVHIRTVDFATWLDEQNSGHFDMLMMGWLGNIDPDDFYYAQHHTNGITTRRSSPTPRSTGCWTPGAPRPIGTPARTTTPTRRRSSPTSAATSTCTTRRSSRPGRRPCPAMTPAATAPSASAPRN